MRMVLSATREAVAAMVAAGLVLLSSAAAGEIIYVDANICPGVGEGTERVPYCSIQVAIDAAVEGDEIVVAPGTYFEAIDFLGNAVWLHSTGGAEVTTIDGTGFFHVVQCVSGEGPGTVLEGFTITGGIATERGGGGQHDRGGGMLNQNSSPTVLNCIFSDNVAWDGAGMHNENSSPTVTGCTFINNEGWETAGGMNNVGSSPTVTNCRFTSNSVDYGGSGAMRSVAGGSPTIVACIFEWNSVSDNAGAMSVSGSNVTITNCAFVGNSATYDEGNGGAIYGNPTVTNCVFIGNSVTGQGGAIHGNATVTNCTFVGNIVEDLDDAAGALSGDPTVTNCILWGNRPDHFFGSPAVTYSNVQGGFPGAGNIDADPLFVDPDNGDYRLQAGSPCIDAGHNWLVPQDAGDLDDDGDVMELLPLDLDGNPRFSADEDGFDPGCGVPAVVDMGAYEYQFVPVTDVRLGDLTGDGAVGMADLSDLIDAWGPCAADCCLPDLDLDGIVGTSDLLAMLAGWGS